MRVLVVDDDPELLAHLRAWLVDAGLSVEAVAGAHEGLAAAATRGFDVVVLDVMPAGPTSGLDVARLLRRSGISTPILMLSARDAVPDRVQGLEAGADDYLVKPFALEELEARVRALARRHLDDRSAVLRLGDVELDTVTRRATAVGDPLRLTAKEARVLEFLLLHRGSPQPQEAIFNGAWGYAATPAPNLVDVYAGRLRRKLLAAGSRVTVVARKRQGYLLEVTDAGTSEAGLAVTVPAPRTDLVKDRFRIE